MICVKNNLILTTAYLFFTTLPLFISYYVKRSFRKKSDELEREDLYYHQCIFTTLDNINCRPHVITKVECGDNCSYRYVKTMVNFLSTAKTSISLCVFMLTLQDIIYELRNAHRRGVCVRIITDKVMSGANIAKEQVARLRGIPVKVQSNTNQMMHHKFCIIDGNNEKSAKMFFGTMNLTMQAIHANFDSIILTNNKEIIKAFYEEFEEIWSELDETVSVV